MKEQDKTQPPMTPKTNQPEGREDQIKQLATSLKPMVIAFFYWWYNQPGSNTAQGFDDYITTIEGRQAIQDFMSATPPATVIQPLQWVKASERLPDNEWARFCKIGAMMALCFYRKDENIWTDETGVKYKSEHIIWLDESTPPNQLSGRFKKPTDEQIVKAALLFADGNLDDKERLSDMVGLCLFVVDRLYENGDILIPSSKENEE